MYFRDPTFKALFEAQAGPLPCPSKEGASLRLLAARVEELERQAGQKLVVDFVRPAKGKIGAAHEAQPEPQLAAQFVAADRSESKRHIQKASGGAAAAAGELGAILESEDKADIEALKPRQVVAIARMNKFSQKVHELVS